MTNGTEFFISPTAPPTGLTTQVNSYGVQSGPFFGFSGCGQSIAGTCDTSILSVETTPFTQTCASTTILDYDLSSVPQNISTSEILVTGSHQINWPAWTDSFSASNPAVNSCGHISYTYTVTAAPVGYVSGTIFTLDQTIPSIKVSPTSDTQVGTYVVSIMGSLSAPYSSIQATMVQKFIILSCTVTSISSLSITDACTSCSTDLFIPNPLLSPRQYQFRVTNNCGYLPDSWSFSMTSNNDAYLSHFNGFSTTTGLYTIQNYNNACYNGKYSLLITGVTFGSQTFALNEVTHFYAGSYSQSGVVCSSNGNVLVSSTIPNFSITVFGALALYGAFSGFTDSYTYSCPNACGSITYSVETVSGTPPTVFSIDSSLQFLAQSTDPSQVGSYLARVRGCLTNFNTVCTTSNTFNVTVEGTCAATVLSSSSPITVENLTAFVGQTIKSNQVYNFTDTVEMQANTLNYCGMKQFSFTIGGMATTYLAGQNGQNIYFSPPVNSSVGTQSASLIVKIGSFFSQSFAFTVTAVSTILPIISNYTYVINSPPITVTFSDFQLSPSSAHQLSFQESYQAYLCKKSSVLTYPLDVTLLQRLPEWISLNILNHSDLHLSVSTNNSSNVGNYQIVLIKTFPSFNFSQAFLSFFVQILQNSTFQSSIPQFSEFPTYQYVEQCSFNNTCDWAYNLPPTKIDNQGNYVTSIKSLFNPAVLLYDQINNRLSQVVCIDNLQNYTVVFQLTNNKGMQAQFSMIVEFGCKQGGSQQLGYSISLQSALNQLKMQYQSPTAFISSIDLDGLMHIHFNTSMKPPQHLYDIKNQTILINGTIWPAINLYIVPGQYSDPIMLNFTWEPVSFSPGQMLVQLNFQNPNFVSSLGNSDKIGITVYAFYLFADLRGNLMLPESVLKPRVLPKQISKDLAAKIKQIGQSTESAVAGAIFANIFISLLITGPLQQLLSAVKQLQLSSIVMLVNVVPPANAQLFYSILMNIVTMNLIDCTDFFNNVFKLDDNGNTGLNDVFGVFGYGSFYVIQNFGTLSWTLFLLPILWLICRMVNCLTNGKFDEIQKKFDNFMLFNGTISLIDENYLLLAISAALNTLYFYWDTIGNAFNSFLSVTIGFVVVITPFLLYFLFSNPSAVQKIVEEDQNFLARCGELLKPLNFRRRGSKVMIYLCLSQLRRLLLVLTVVYLQNYPIIYSIISLHFQTLMMIITTGYVEPYIQKTSNIMELLNECFILIQTYQILCFTNFLGDSDMQSLVGMSLIVVQCSNILFNILLVTLQTAYLTVHKFRLGWLQRKFRLELKAKFHIRQEELKVKFIEQQVKDLQKRYEQVQKQKLLMKQKVSQNQIHFKVSNTAKFEIDEPNKGESYQISSQSSKNKFIVSESCQVEQSAYNNGIEIQLLTPKIDKEQRYNRIIPKLPSFNQSDQLIINPFLFDLTEQPKHVVKTSAQIQLEEHKEWAKKNFVFGQSKQVQQAPDNEINLDSRPYNFTDDLLQTANQPQLVQMKTIPEKLSMYETILQIQRNYENKRRQEINNQSFGN